MTRFRPLFPFAALALAGLVFVRLRYGIDFTDEAYYAAMAVRFLRGDIPFLDELFVNQTAVLVLLPFVKPYFQRFGTEGILYFLRVLYFLFALGIGATAYFALRRFGKGSQAAAASLVALAFIPLNIPALSYNTLGGGLFAAAIFLELSGAWFIACVALAFAQVCYPPLAIAGLGFLYLGIRQNRKRFGTALLAHGLVALLFVPMLYRAGGGLAQSFLYSWHAHHNGGGLTKLAYVAKFIVANASAWLSALSFVLLAAAYYFRSKRPTGAAALLISFPLLQFLAYRDWIFPSNWVFTNFSLAAPVFFLLAPGPDRKLLRAWMLFLAAGITTAWVSSGSPANFIVGMWGGGILSAYFYFKAVDTLLPGPSFPILASRAVALGGLVLFLFQGQSFYCDGEWSRLSTPIESGPFAGLVTTPEKAKYLADITRDIHLLENPKGKIVFYEFPAGYLLTTMRPGSNSAWMRTVSQGKDFYRRYYEKNLSLHDLVFAIHTIDHGYLSPVLYSEKDPFVAFVRETHRMVLTRDNYQVFAPNPSKTL